MLSKSGVFLISTCILFLGLLSFHNTLKDHPVIIEYPNSWPKPVYDFSKNPLTREKIELGRHLFYEPELSLDNTISCSSCHLSFSSFTHTDHALSHGIFDSIGNRNSPVLINLAWNSSFMLDGAINHLDFQALAPIESETEMGEELSNVIIKLQKQKKYKTLFYLAFGDSIITGEHLLKALSQFQLTLVSANSKYDKVMRKEPGISFTKQEMNGYQLFKSNCGSCHTEPLFTNGEFANNGLPIDDYLKDMGRMAITQNPADSIKFKIPTLRNIEYSYPYMHDGRFRRLSEVIKHYTETIQDSPTLAPELVKKITLTGNERVDLVAFLLTLSDREFIFNPTFFYPKN